MLVVKRKVGEVLCVINNANGQTLAMRFEGVSRRTDGDRSVWELRIAIDDPERRYEIPRERDATDFGRKPA